MRLGELLVKKGLVTEKQLLKGSSRHYRTHELLGECLILEGMISESSLLSALSEQLELPYFEVIPTDWMSKEALALIPGALAKKWCVISGENEQGFIVFFNDNRDDVAYMMAEKGKQVSYALSKKSQIREAIDKFFRN